MPLNGSGQRAGGVVDPVGDGLAVVPVELEEPAERGVPLGPRAHLVVGPELGGLRLAVADLRCPRRSRRRRRHDRAVVRHEVGLGHLAGLCRVHLVEPGTGDAAELLAAEHLVAVGVALGHQARADGYCGADARAEARQSRGEAGAPLAGFGRLQLLRARMVRVGGGVDRGDTLAVADERQECLAARCRGGGVLRVVEKVPGGTREEDRVVLRQIRLGDVGGIPADRRRPGAGLPAEFLDGAGGDRDRRVDEARGTGEHEHLARPRGLGRRGRRQGRDHRRRRPRGRPYAGSRCDRRTAAPCRAARARGRR